MAHRDRSTPGAQKHNVDHPLVSNRSINLYCPDAEFYTLDSFESLADSDPEWTRREETSPEVHASSPPEGHATLGEGQRLQPGLQPQETTTDATNATTASETGDIRAGEGLRPPPPETAPDCASGPHQQLVGNVNRDRSTPGALGHIVDHPLVSNRSMEMGVSIGKFLNP